MSLLLPACLSCPTIPPSPSPAPVNIVCVCVCVSVCAVSRARCIIEMIAHTLRLETQHSPLSQHCPLCCRVMCVAVRRSLCCSETACVLRHVARDASEMYQHLARCSYRDVSAEIYQRCILRCIHTHQRRRDVSTRNRDALKQTKGHTRNLAGVVTVVWSHVTRDETSDETRPLVTFVE